MSSAPEPHAQHAARTPCDSAESSQRSAVLNQLSILSPCEVAWDGMAGGERERHCASCSKTVHNLIEHTAEEAYQLVTVPGAHVCVRMHRDAAGNVLTKDSLPDLVAAPSPTRRGMLGRLAAMAAGWFGLTALAGCNKVAVFADPEQGEACHGMLEYVPPSSLTPAQQPPTSSPTPLPKPSSTK